MWTEINRFVLSLCTRVRIRREEGQALVEYTLIVALVSIVAVAALTGLGEDLAARLTEVQEGFSL